MHRRILACAAAAALGLTLLACGSGGSGTVTEPPPTVNVGKSSDGGGRSDNGGGSPSDSGGSDGDGGNASAAPDIPAPDPADYPGKDENTPEGAEQAFRYYIAVSMWSHQVGDDTLLKTLQAEDCSSCDEFNGALPELIENGDHWGEFDVVDTDTSIHDSENYDHEISYLFIITEHSRPDFDTGGRYETPQIHYIAVGGMTFRNDTWMVGGVDSEWGPNEA